MRLIDKEYTDHPFVGYRKMEPVLLDQGYVVNRKRVQRLMQAMGLVAVVPGPHNRRRAVQHPIYPYLLRGVKIERVNQVWSCDITYLPMPKGFLYLFAIEDWRSRAVLAWELSTTLDTAFCLQGLERALKCGKPEIFNSDQGCQFTSADFTGRLLQDDIRISMDGRGRAYDNIFIERLWRSVKYEDFYLHNYETPREVRTGLTSYFEYYNHKRHHQALGYRKPAAVHQELGGMLAP